MCAHTADIVLLTSQGLLLCEFTQQNSRLSFSLASDPVTVGPEEINITL